MRHVLRLTFRQDDPISPEAAGAYARKVRAILLDRESDAEAARAALERLRAEPSASRPQLTASQGYSEHAALLAAAAAARRQLADGPAEASLASEPIALPSVPDACASRHAGIHALEIYTPRLATLVKCGWRSP